MQIIKRKKVEPAFHSFSCLLHLSEEWNTCSRHSTRCPESSVSVSALKYQLRFSEMQLHESFLPKL